MLKVGVLGASRIVRPALMNVGVSGVTVETVAARDAERAQQFARDHGIPRASESYRALIDDSDLDAVYVALPASEHDAAVEAALRAGKHVLCEKPFGLSAEQAQARVRQAEAACLVLMEAHHWRYHPLLAEVEKAIESLGSQSRVTARFTAGVDDPGDIRRNPRLGPGVTMDFGCYLMQWVRWVTQHDVDAREEELRVEAARMEGCIPGVDERLAARLSRGPVELTVEADMSPGTPFEAWVEVQGERGRVRFDNPLGTEGSRVAIEPERGSSEVVESPLAPSTYENQLRVFVSAVESKLVPPTSGRDIVETMALIESLYRAAGERARAELRASALE